MADSITAARPYAKALYEIASQEQARDWLPMMQVCAALSHSEESKNFLNTHDLTLAKLDTFLQGVFAKVGIDAVPAKFNDFLKVLSKNKRYALLPEIASLFIEAVNRSDDTVLANIVSAKVLSEKDKATLISGLEKKFSKKVEASIQIDESLIGGAIISVGDSVIDGSIKGKLEQLSKSLI